MTVDDITEAVRLQFRDAPPNGWLLGWNESRHFQLIRSASTPLPVINCTSFDYSFCNFYEARVNDEENAGFWTLTVKLSFIVPACCIYWTQYKSPTKGWVVDMAPVGYQQIEDRVRTEIVNAGFFELPREWHDVKVNGVELELSGDGEGDVTLDKCLFEDHPG